MVSKRQSGDLSGNGSRKRSPSSSGDKPPTKHQKSQDDGASVEEPADKDGDQTVTEETSKETNTLPPDSGDSASISAKIEASPADTTTSPPVALGSTPTLVEKPIEGCKFEKPWCKLLSQSGQHSSLRIYTSPFTIGSSYTCDFTLRDQIGSEVWCKIIRNQLQGNVVALLEITATMGPVLINGTLVEKNTSHVLHSGDEVVFGSLRNYAFIFQQMSEVAVKGRKKSSSHASSKSCQALEKSATSVVHDLTRNLQQASTSGNVLRSAIFREGIQACIVEGESLEVSFEKFPYYLSENTKNVLIAASHIHLKKKEYAEYGSGLTTLNPRILLSGPAGTEIYQEMLAKALANYFKAKILVFDSLPILEALTAKEIAGILENTNELDRLRTEQGEVLVEINKMHEKLQATPEIVDKPGDTSLSKLKDLYIQAKELAESEVTVSNILLIQLDSLLPSKPTGQERKKIGDRVRFFGAGLFPGPSTSRGPSYRSKGKVILVFDENPSAKVGVKFDKPIPDGVDLGKLCKKGHGFFCNDTDLRLESSGFEELDKLLINTLFEVVHTESRTSPFILYLKDAEKFVAGNSDSYSAFRSRLECLPENVIVISPHTHSDNLLEKSHRGGLSFIKFGSSKISLRGRHFPDTGRLRERDEKVSKATKLLTDLFGNKVTIQMPQGNR